MLKLLPFLVMTLFFTYSCNASKAYENNILTVDQVRDKPEYASQIVDVRGEVIYEYHGRALCSPNGESGFFVVLPIKGDPEQGFELEEDYLESVIRVRVLRQQPTRFDSGGQAHT